MSDGDLWDHFEKALRAKGTNAVNLTWVKGHATQQHIDAGVSNPVDKSGNDAADEAADVGTLLHGRDLLGTMHAMQNRFNKYFNTMKKISQHNPT